ncbi:MAG: hypothetical protein KDA75_09305 [Planctomycetaceae bacterium]|nr:hypothetical protein [Planctomycetaceae bacterium]
MPIQKEQMYHGAALAQIAEHPHFTAINELKIKNLRCKSAFLVNDSTVVYLKYCSKPKGPSSEYVFNFDMRHRADLAAINNSFDKVYLALVCVEDMLICAPTYDEFEAILAKREAALGGEEEIFSLLAVIPEGKSFRLYANKPGKRGVMLAPVKIISRSRFPDCLFE